MTGDLGRLEREFPSQHLPELFAVMCGAKGFSSWSSVSIAERGRTSAVNAFVKIIICEIAVLKLSFSMSSPTFLIVAWTTLAPRFRLGDCGGDDPFAGLVFLHDQAPDAGEETRDAFDAGHAPGLHLLERSHEHLVTAEGVRAVFAQITSSGFTTLPRRLGHLLAVFARG